MEPEDEKPVLTANEANFLLRMCLQYEGIAAMTDETFSVRVANASLITEYANQVANHNHTKQCKLKQK